MQQALSLYVILKRQTMIVNLALTDHFKNAIETNNEVSFDYKYGIGDKNIKVILQPYILGSDIFQYDFVWGLIPYNMTFYKFLIDNISSFRLTNNRYELSSEACYQYMIEEEHYAILENFHENIYVRSAI
jgi:hypothetical protein